MFHYNATPHSLSLIKYYRVFNYCNNEIIINYLKLIKFNLKNELKIIITLVNYIIFTNYSATMKMPKWFFLSANNLSIFNFNIYAHLIQFDFPAHLLYLCAL